MTKFNCGDQDVVECFAIDCLLVPACVRQLTVSKARLVCKLRDYCRHSIYSLWYLAVNSLWHQYSALLESRAIFRKSNALRRICMNERSMPSGVALLPNSVRCVPTLPLATKVWKLQWGSKNKVLAILSFWGYKRFALMRGFQIWSHDWNWITFDPIFGPKRWKTGKTPYFVSFWPFFCHKWGQMLSNFNFETRFGILS